MTLRFMRFGGAALLAGMASAVFAVVLPAPTSASAGFSIKVNLKAATNKPPQAAEPDSCAINKQHAFDKFHMKISCTAGHAVQARYYNSPVYGFLSGTGFISASDDSLGGLGGTGEGTTSFMRVYRQSSEDLQEVWVSW